MRRLKDLGNILGVYFFRKGIPFKVNFSITSRCNTVCSYCSIWKERPGKEMDFNQISVLIRDLARMGTKVISFGGGEPFLRSDMAEILSLCKKNRIFTTLSSNGKLVQERVAALKYLDVLNLSLDGPLDIHDQCRGAGSYKGVKEAFKIAKEAGQKVYTTTVITKYNVNDLDFILETAEEEKSMALFQPLHHTREKSGDIASLIPPISDYRRAIKKLIEQKKSGGPILSSLSYLNFLYRWKDYSYPIQCPQKNPHSICRTGQFFCHIDPQGRFTPCFNRLEGLNWLEVGAEKAFNGIRGLLNPGSCINNIQEYNFAFSLRFSTLGNLVYLKNKGCLQKEVVQTKLRNLHKCCSN